MSAASKINIGAIGAKMKENKQMAQLLNNTEKHLHNMFLAGAIIAALSCFARADYNLPMFAFLYIMWDQDDVSKDFKCCLN